MAMFTILLFFVTLILQSTSITDKPQLQRQWDAQLQSFKAHVERQTNHVETKTSKED